MWHTTSASSPDDIPQLAIKLTASLAVLVVSAMCVATPTLGTRAAVVFTSVKVISILTKYGSYVDVRVLDNSSGTFDSHVYSNSH